MDLVGLLAASAGLGLFPGGLFALVAGAATARAARLGGGAARWAGSDLAGLACAVVALSLVPLPGSPSAVLPAGGAPANLVATLLLLTCAVALVRRSRVGLLHAVVGTATVLPLLTTAALVGSTSAETVALASSPGAVVGIRLIGAGVLVIAMPILLDAGDTRQPRLARGTILAATGAVALFLAAGTGLRERPVWLAAVATLAGAAIYGGCTGAALRNHRGRELMVLLCCLGAVAGATLALSTALR